MGEWLSELQEAKPETAQVPDTPSAAHPLSHAAFLYKYLKEKGSTSFLLKESNTSVMTYKVTGENTITKYHNSYVSYKLRIYLMHFLSGQNASEEEYKTH